MVGGGGLVMEDLSGKDALETGTELWVLETWVSVAPEVVATIGRLWAPGTCGGL